MKKYKMTETDKCPSGGQAEISKHLMWECEHVKIICSFDYNLMIQVMDVQERMHEEILQASNCLGLILLKQRL